MPQITLTDVTKNYGGSTNAVNGLDLTIEDGDFMCILGPSGCGKTTTIRMIAGLESATNGSITIGDQTVDQPATRRFVRPESRDLGMVFQNYALWPHLSVADNIDYGLKLKKLDKPARRQRIEEVLDSLSIAQYRDRYPAQLSGGQQQRVALARMLAVRPHTMLLDEPLSNLDSRLRLEMRAELKRIHAETNATIAFVTHDQWEAMTLATSIAVMSEGVLQQVGSAEEIYGRPANRFVAEFVGNPPINIVDLAGDADALGVAAARHASGRGFPEAGSIGFRPESVRVLAATDAATADGLSVPATLTAVLPTGGSWILEFDVDGRRLFGTTSVANRHPVGTRVSLAVDAADVHLFDRSGDRA